MSECEHEYAWVPCLAGERIKCIKCNEPWRKSFLETVNEITVLNRYLETAHRMDDAVREALGINDGSGRGTVETIVALKREIAEYDVVLDNVGIYPKSVAKADGTIIHERTPYEDGWNACIMWIREHMIDKAWIENAILEETNHE